MASNDVADSLPLSRVLAKRPGFYRMLRRGDDLGILYDKSSLPYLVEEFVASAAVDIAITATSPAVEHLDGLHPTLRSRVILIDTDGKVGKQLAAILEPVGSEFEFRFSESLTEIHATPKTPIVVREVLGELLFNLYDFLLGAEHRLQVDVDLPKLQHAVATLRENARSPEARANLAVLQAAFVNYRPVRIASLALQSAATDQQIERFKRFVEDTTYQRVSRDAGLLGVPEDGDRAVVLIERGVKKLVSMPLFKPISAIGSKLISKASALELDAADLVQALLPKRYLPPIISLTHAYARAEALWAKQREKFVETDATVKMIGEGWIELEDEPQPTVLDFARGSQV
jgi:hypothetical protein